MKRAWELSLSAVAGRDMVGALGAEVDRLETEIQQIMPGIRHIDLVRLPPGCVVHGEIGRAHV